MWPNAHFAWPHIGSSKYTLHSVYKIQIHISALENTDMCGAAPNAQRLGHHLRHAPFIIVVLMVPG